MNGDTVYLKAAQITEVYAPDVFLKDIAQVYCRDKAAEAKAKAVKVVSFPAGARKRGVAKAASDAENVGKNRNGEKAGKQRETETASAPKNMGKGESGAGVRAGKAGRRGGRKNPVYVGDVIELAKKIEAACPGVSVSSVGKSEFIVRYRRRPFPPRVWEWGKTAFVAAVAFCGAAFAIMTFNNDANVTDVFAKLYALALGRPSDGRTILEVSYSVGLAFGILLFFNHFASWKLTADPTPIEVEMRLYEENLDKALIQDRERKESGIDVS